MIIEEDLKAGRIPCLVATSSLELGIDMGAVDLVIQVESPKSVARGLQRVGRAGHELGATSKGRIFPKFRADLLECAVVAKAMREGAIEETAIPRNPLDVLAQQIVAICAEDEIAVDDLFALVRGAHPFAELTRQQLDNVLDMLAGRYPSDEFAELRPRIVWDRTAGVIRGRSSARRLAVTNAGTIPDRGLYGVFQVDGGGRVGELDEEMVYEAREGQTFMLGASTWRIEEITRDRVLVSPAPGIPGAVPFWKGEGVGRPYELGARIGAASRELAALSDASGHAAAHGRVPPRRARGAQPLGVPPRAGAKLGAADRSHSRRRALPRRDRRLAGVHPHAVRRARARALVDGARRPDPRRARARGAVAVVRRRDRAPLSRRRRTSRACRPPGRAGRGRGSRRPGGGKHCPLRVAVPRERGTRAADPAPAPGQRTPLWQQRLKAQSLLEVARKYGSFPIVLETYRECLQDVFDLPALRGILHGLATRELDLVEVETPSASPMGASLLFDYVATYMYEDDTPAAERRAQALSLDRELLRELLGQEELRELLDPGALEEVESSLRPVPRNADELHDLLRRVGDLRGEELDAGFAETLVRERRAFRARVGGAEAVIAAEDAGLYRDAFGVMPPGGLPEAFLEPVDDALERVFLRYARSRGPFTTREAVSRYGLEADAVETLLGALEARDLLVRGELRPGGIEREWCDPDVLRRIRRASLAVLRRQVEPAEQATLGRFLPGWHGIDRRATLREALVPLQGLALPVSLWETEILPRRVPGYQPSWLDQLCASGEVVWVGAGLDRVALYYREDAPVLGAPGSGEPLDGPVHDTIRATLNRSAEFWLDLVASTGLDSGDVLPALWELVWNGEVTNDAWAPLRAKRRYGVPSVERRPRRFSRTRLGGEVATAGRWSLATRLFEPGRERRTAARSRSSCSSGRGSSRATVCARRASRAGTAPCTAS